MYKVKTFKFKFRLTTREKDYIVSSIASEASVALSKIINFGKYPKGTFELIECLPHNHR